MTRRGGPGSVTFGLAVGTRLGLALPGLLLVLILLGALKLPEIIRS
jgi:hypothetical protein